MTVHISHQNGVMIFKFHDPEAKIKHRKNKSVPISCHTDKDPQTLGYLDASESGV